MKWTVVILIILGSGATAGLVSGTVNAFVVNPYTEQATNIENQKNFERGIIKDTKEFQVEYESYREWQRNSQILASVILGVATGSLFGAVFAISKDSIPGKNYISKSIILAVIMWAVLYMIPFIKYPPNPPAVGDPDTITIRTILYIVLVVASALGAVVFAKITTQIIKTKKTNSKNATCIGIVSYVAFVTTLCILLPSNPDPTPQLSSDLLDGFRVASAIGIASFWISIGAIFGLAWTVYTRKDNNTHENLNSDSMY